MKKMIFYSLMSIESVFLLGMKYHAILIGEVYLGDMMTTFDSLLTVSLIGLLIVMSYLLIKELKK